MDKRVVNFFVGLGVISACILGAILFLVFISSSSQPSTPVQNTQREVPEIQEALTTIPEPTLAPEPTPTICPNAPSFQDISSTLDGMTDAQQNNYMESLVGACVQDWQGTVTDVNEGEIFGGFKVLVDVDSDSFFDVAFDVDEDTALSINLNQDISFSGTINYITNAFGISIDLENVIIH